MTPPFNKSRHTRKPLLHPLSPSGCSLMPPHCPSMPPHCPLTPLHCPLTLPNYHLTLSRRPLGPLGRLLTSRRRPLTPPIVF